MKSRKLAENKDTRMEIIEMEEFTRKLLPALNEMVKEAKKQKEFPECLCLVIAINKKQKMMTAGMIDSIEGISEKAQIKMLKVKEEFLNV